MQVVMYINSELEMGLLERILGTKKTAENDARNIYSILMQHSRNPDLFGIGKLPDNYDGRIEALTIHLAVFIERLGKLGEDGLRLSQSLFDVMVDDFNVAMREEGLTDTGIKHRIKPMVSMFYNRLRGYAESMSDISALNAHLDTGITHNSLPEFRKDLTDYILSLHKQISTKELDELAALKFDFPKFT